MASKFNNKRVTYDDIAFDSQAEMRRYIWLKDEEAQGNIYGLGVHTVYELEPKMAGYNHWLKKAETLRAITHEVDFSYFLTSTKRLVVEDVKGVETAVWRMKHNLFRRHYPQIEYRVIPAKDC